MLSSLSIINKTNSQNNSIDYIFTDSPFGGNPILELNFWEAWLRSSNNKPEAIENKVRAKGCEYQALMTRCFEYYRVLAGAMDDSRVS